MRPTRFPATPQPQLVQCEKVGVVDLLFVAGVANVSQHAHYSSLITLHSSLFTLHSSPFEREHPYETLQPAPWRHQDPPNVHRGVNAHFQCREYAGNRHVHGTLITLHSSLFTLHSSLFTRGGELSPQPKATSRSSTVLPGRVGPGAVRKVWGVVHGVHWIQIRIANANFHALRAGRNALALPRRRLRVHPQASPRRLVRDQGPPRAPGRQNRARCAYRAALGRRASNSVSPPSLGRASIPPDSSISKSSPIDLEFECPVVAFKIERAKCQVGAPSQSSMTKRSFRHGLEFCTGWCRPSCSTWKFKQFDFFSTVWASGRRRGRSAYRRLLQAGSLVRS